VLTGSVLATPAVGGIIGGVIAGGTLTITAGMGGIPWSVTAGAGDAIAFEATAAGTSGTWTATQAVNGATASITNELAPANATVGTGPGVATYPSACLMRLLSVPLLR